MVSGDSTPAPAATSEQGTTPMNDVAPMRQLSPATQPISPAKFAHFVLRTGQFETMAKWYQTVLAARVVFRDEMLCFLSYDDEHHRLALINIPDLPVRDPDAVGSPTVTTISASCCRPIAGSRRPASCRIGRSTTASRRRCITATPTTTGSNCRSTISQPRP